MSAVLTSKMDSPSWLRVIVGAVLAGLSLPLLLQASYWAQGLQSQDPWYAIAFGVTASIVTVLILQFRQWTQLWQITIAAMLVGLVPGIRQRIVVIANPEVWGSPAFELLDMDRPFALWRLLIDAIESSIAAPIFWLIVHRGRTFWPRPQAMGIRMYTILRIVGWAYWILPVAPLLFVIADIVSKVIQPSSRAV